MSNTTTTDRETHHAETDWLHVGGRFAAYYLTSIVGLYYLTLLLSLSFDNFVVESTTALFFYSAAVLLVAFPFAVVVTWFDYNVFGNAVEDRWTVRGKNLRWGIVWACGGLVTPIVWGIVSLLTDPSSLAGVDGVVAAGMFFAVGLALTALPTVAIILLRAYWNRDTQIRLRWVVVGILVLGVVAAGAAAAGNGGFLTDDDDSYYPDSDADPDYSNVPISAYDDGEYGPMAAPGNISIKESERGDVLTCDETAGPVPDSVRERDIIRGYEPAAVHNDSGRISVAPYEITIDGETQELNGHYHIRIENRTTFSRESIIEVGTYDVEAAETSFESVTRSGDGSVVMEQVDSMSVYYDVIHEDGEVHRYTTRLCRS